MLGMQWLMKSATDTEEHSVTSICQPHGDGGGGI
jgi:hypothetical protein